MKKIGIMGGTFNPIHYGHLFLAENAFERFELDQILFMPSKNPPHKAEMKIASEEHRLNMVRLAIKDNPHFALSTMELDREGVTYTKDTLTILTKEHPDYEYYFIVGTDSLMMIENWKEPQTILGLSTIIVAGRDHLPKETLEMQITKLKNAYHARIEELDMPTIEISSENIRERLAAKKTIRYYTPDEVINFINKHNLYGITVD